MPNANRSTTVRAKPTGHDQPNKAELVKTARTLQDQELMPVSKNLCLQNGAGSETISEREK
jgi:hypothetical protein